MRILGIDPGLIRIGWGAVKMDGNRISHVENGSCASQGDDLATRLMSLFEQLTDVVARLHPDSAAVEQTFVNKDGAVTLKLGQARAVALLVPARAGIVVGEYAPNTVKKTVVGVGHAQKRQVEHMVKMQLPGVTIDGSDAADALAIALCHAHHMNAASNRAAAMARSAA